MPNDRLELIKALKSKYRIYLLSNTNSIHIDAFKKQLGIVKWQEFSDLFDKMYLSHEVGMRKPNAEIFEHILAEQKLKAEEVFFIDDSPQHIEGAKKIGIQSHHLLDNEEITTLFPGIIQ